MDLGPGWDDALRAWRRMTRRVSAHSPAALDTLSDLSAIRRQLDHVELLAVRTARSQGRSWAEIATHLGITRQSAWERWRDLDDEDVLDVAVDELMRARRHRKPDQVIVPDVIGLSCDDARQILLNLGLLALLHNAGGDPIPLTTSTGVIRDQVPKAGSVRRLGSAVTVWIDRGGEAGVREPRRPRPPVGSDTVQQDPVHDPR